jgi:phosphoribosylformylglycinamidine synthase
MFSLMWSEHCSYKHSRRLLRAFPTSGPGVLQGPGENAGVVDVGDGWAVALKVESHNHPSAVEPFEGAATGVGGIVRDILAMGARPIALLDSLRFGELTSPRSRHLLTRAVAGIGHYGNCIGVPTVGGELGFDPCYEDSCLVNAMCVGVVGHDGLLRSAARGSGNALVLIGNRTGRDGIGGASVLASAELSHDEDRRPSVQVSDPFTERKLMDCCLELAAAGLLVSLQDLGAAGLTSAASEMAGKGGVGLRIDLDRVPLREEGMAAAEILVSESQERMLAVVEPARLSEVVAACRRWELEAEAIGEVTGDGRLVAVHGGETVADLPAALLTDGAPTYDVPLAAPPPPAPLDLAAVPQPADLAGAWRELLGRPGVGGAGWVYEQYDHLVGAGTVRRPGTADAAVLRLPGTDRAIAITLDGGERHCQLDPRGGGRAVVLEAARNLACSGARPLAVTDCLNFGNPEKPPTGWRLREVIEGMAEACRTLGLPVVSGNVSLYNESAGRVIHPTPVVGMVGVLEDAARSVGIAFAEEGDAILLLGAGAGRLDASAYLGRAEGRPAPVDLEREAALVRLLVHAVEEGLVRSAHDVSGGGLAVALAECAIAGAIGASVSLRPEGRPDEALFGEGGGRALVTPRDEAALGRVRDLAASMGVAATRLGTVGGDRLEVELAPGGLRVVLGLAEARDAYHCGMPGALEA